MSESDGVYQLNDAQLAKAWHTCAETAERQRDTARRWANAWKAAAKDMRTLVGLTEDRAALNLELLHKAERELAAERETREGLEMRVASLESALREEIAWKELEQHKKEKAEAEMERIRADNRTIGVIPRKAQEQSARLARLEAALREHADDLQALMDEVYQAGGEMTGTQWERVATVDRRAYGDVLRLDSALFDWSNEQRRRRDKISKEKGE